MYDHLKGGVNSRLGKVGICKYGLSEINATCYHQAKLAGFHQSIHDKSVKNAKKCTGKLARHHADTKYWFYSSFELQGPLRLEIANVELRNT